LGGSSAGGFAALHVAYLDQNEAPSSITGGLLSPDLGCLDCSGNNFNHSVELAGLVNLWGALGDSSFVDADETVPTLLVHGTADGVVPFGVGQPFGVFTTPFVHGSRTISNQLNSLGIPHSTLFFAGQDHEPHGTSNGTFDTPPTPYWDTIFDAIAAMESYEYKPSARLYNEIILAFSSAGDGVAAEYYYWEMKRKGIQPDSFTYRYVLEAYAKAQTIGSSRYGWKGRYVKAAPAPLTPYQEAMKEIGARRTIELSKLLLLHDNPSIKYSVFGFGFRGNCSQREESQDSFEGLYRGRR
jgi:pentatricopeptide repeat protein